MARKVTAREALEQDAEAYARMWYTPKSQAYKAVKAAYLAGAGRKHKKEDG